MLLWNWCERNAFTSVKTVAVTFANGVQFWNTLFGVRPAKALLITPTADFPDLMSAANMLLLCKGTYYSNSTLQWRMSLFRNKSKTKPQKENNKNHLGPHHLILHWKYFLNERWCGWFIWGSAHLWGMSPMSPLENIRRLLHIVLQTLLCLVHGFFSAFEASLGPVHMDTICV